jgi:hypothetical protein
MLGHFRWLPIGNGNDGLETRTPVRRLALSCPRGNQFPKQRRERESPAPRLGK